MRKYILCPLAALALGCGGAALRMCGFTLPLMLLCAVAVALFALWALLSKNCRGGGLFTCDGFLTPVVLILAAALLAVSAMFRLAHAATLAGVGPDSQVPPLLILTTAPMDVALALLAVPAVVALAFLAKEIRAGGEKLLGSAAVVFPALFCWVWLIDLYRSNTSDPVISHYIFLMAAVIFFLLTALGRAGFAFKDGNPRFTLFSGLCAIALFPILLTHDPAPVLVLTAAAFFLYALCTVTGLLRNLPLPQTAPETEIETETETEVPSDE